MKTILLIILLAGEMSGQNVKKHTANSWRGTPTWHRTVIVPPDTSLGNLPHQNMRVYGAQNVKGYPCDSVFVIDSALYSGNGRVEYEHGHMVPVPCFTIKDVDRYLSECYADSEIVVTPEYQYWVHHLGVVPQREVQHFKNTGALMRYLSHNSNGNNISIEITHLKPTFDDFKKWLRKR